MEEDIFGMSRNGHDLKDMYEPETNTLDIRSNGLYPSNVLSNLCSNAFTIDGVECGSMEGFLQSLKYKDVEKQRQICSMKGGNACKHSTSSWQKDQVIWWKGQSMDRHGWEYAELLEKAYEAMFEQNEQFRKALISTIGKNLSHTSGKVDPNETILTSYEFIENLTNLRDIHYYWYLERKLNKILSGKSFIFEQGFKDVEGACFRINQLDLPNWKLIVRTDAFYIGRSDGHRQCIEKYSKGLLVEDIVSTEKGSEFEIILSPQPLDNHDDDYILATNFVGEFYVTFYVLINDHRIEIDSFDYISK